MLSTKRNRAIGKCSDALNKIVHSLKFNYLRLLLFAAALGAAGFNSTAQLTVDNSMNVDAVVQTLLGPGVEVFNVTFSGGADQRGTFDASNTTLDIASGIMLATGDINVGLGPNLEGAASLGGGSFGASDPDLDQLDGFTHNDAAILEFDFVATGDEVSFKYIWASEEYPEYTGAGTCGNVSDVFGFFISGPGISGPFQNNAENIALIPGSSQFVSIFNLNAGCLGVAQPGDADCNFCEYYVHNGTGGEAPWSEGSQYVEFDGYTVILTAYATLQCGETYHIKLAVADVSDTIFDSAVFLEESSFNVANSIVTAFVAMPAPGQGNSDMLEDCDIQGEFIIVPPACLQEEEVINITYTGSATYGDDYTTNVVGDLLIVPGVSDTITVFPVDDDIVEGLETITITFVYTNNEGVIDTAYATLNIINYTNMTVAPIDPLFICPGSDAEATAIPVDGYGPFEYVWSSGGDEQTETYEPGQAGTYIVTVADYCGSEAYAEFQVVEPVPFVPIDSVDACVGMNISFLQFGGALPYTYAYDTLEFYYNEADESFQPLISGQYTINLLDECGQNAIITVFASVCDTWVPNIFTPNGDGENDYFEVYGLEAFPNSTITVFNRWGNMVYENTNYKNTWQGDDLPDGTYYWLLHRVDGLEEAGYVQLVRETK